MAAKDRVNFDQLTAATQAGILCNDPRFQAFAAARLDLTRLGLKSAPLTPTAAAHFLRNHCRIASRRELNTNPAAARKFAILRTEFDAWRGRLPAQR